MFYRNALNVVKDDLIAKVDELTRSEVISMIDDIGLKALVLNYDLTFRLCG